MASTIKSNTTSAPPQPSPLARRTSPFMDPRTPPCTPSQTSKLWDKYEKSAVERAKSREKSPSPPPLSAKDSPSLRPLDSGRFSSGTVLDIIKSYDPYASPRMPATTLANSSAAPGPKFDFGFPVPGGQHAATGAPFPARSASAGIALCKTCKRSITIASGICEKCKKTIVVSSRNDATTLGHTTPPLSPSRRNFASIDLAKLHRQESANSTPMQSRSSSPSRKQCQPDPPIRLSSLRPPPPPLPTSSPPSPTATDAPRSRKTSLNYPHEPLLRTQVKTTSRKQYPSTAAPSTPARTSTSSHHRSSTSRRSSSIAHIITPPSTNYPSPTTAYLPSQYSSRHKTHISETPSDLAAQYPYGSSYAYASYSSPTSPNSVWGASYQLQNTISVWEDWDDDEGEEGEKVGLVGRLRVWRERRSGEGGDESRRGSEERDVRKHKEGKEKEKENGNGAEKEKESRSKTKSQSKKSSNQKEFSKQKERERVSSRDSSVEKDGSGHRRKRTGTFLRVVSCGGCGNAD
ncbi:hypothetical protein GQ43DRAFT_243557 [Delitschia confertaspora ATCC 74209]|uniref:Uncharacterized protein n=1 Tax=Delitschia confertaspora ATCC 74209 TaxID=1513339 RepID=A0A9P4JBZ6_9PLEO|nr:hypothetical protein GQ43DRAFT_243557 [Delitschia confertaspora ATCC 74209]